jgi:hypothetical protein
MSGPNTGTSSADDEFVLFIVGCVAAAALVGSAGLFWLTGVGWLVEHQVLVSAAEHPLVALPDAGGAGLDLSRLAVVAAVVIALVAWAASAIHHRVAAARSVE